MAYGIQITNSSGFLQVDDIYPQYRVIQEGTGTHNTDIYFPTQSAIPVIAIRPLTTDNCVGRLHHIFLDHFKAMVNTFSTGASGGQFYYKVLVPVNTATPPGAGDFGLVVYNSSNTVVFNSEQDNMFRVLAVPTVTPNVFVTETQFTFSNPSGAPTWFIFNVLPFESFTPIGEGNEWTYEYSWWCIRRVSETVFGLSRDHMLEVVFTADPEDAYSYNFPFPVFVGTFT